MSLWIFSSPNPRIATYFTVDSKWYNVSAYAIVHVDISIFRYLFDNPGDISFRKEMDEWKAQKIDIILSASRPDPAWMGRTEHVQAHFVDAMKPLRNPVVLICGMKEMMEQGKAVLAGLNVAPADILSNY